MHKFYAPTLLLAFCVTFACCEPYSDNSAAGAANHPNTLLSEADSGGDSRGTDGDSNYDKRVERYAFGLGRRAYTYPNNGNGVKRLPVYNFGLGKRARPYSFGLGKRADFDDVDQYDADFSDTYNKRSMDEQSRPRPYNFGPGKRDALEDVDRRGYPNRYGFGLGRR